MDTSMMIFLSYIGGAIAAMVAGILIGKHVQRRGDEKIIANADRERFAAIDARTSAETASAVAKEVLIGQRELSALLMDMITNKDKAYALLQSSIEHTNDRAAAMHAVARDAMTEARTAITEAVSIAKVASEQMFGANTGDPGEALSVGNADRAAAVRLREEREEAARR